MQKNRLEWEALKKQLAAQFAPAAKEVLENFGKLVAGAGQALIDSGIIEGVAEILEMLANMITPLANLLSTADEAPGRLKPVYEILHTIALVFAAIEDAMTAIAGLAPWNWGSGMFKNAIGLGYNSGNANNVQRLQMQRAGTLDQYDEYYANKQGKTTYSGLGYDTATGQYYDERTGNYVPRPGQNAGGTDNWRGGLTWVGEARSERVALPAGASIYSSQDSLGASTINNYITVNGLQELEALLTWIESRRVRSRMR